MVAAPFLWFGPITHYQGPCGANSRRAKKVNRATGSVFESPAAYLVELCGCKHSRLVEAQELLRYPYPEDDLVVRIDCDFHSSIEQLSYWMVFKPLYTAQQQVRGGTDIQANAMVR